MENKNQEQGMFIRGLAVKPDAHDDGARTIAARAREDPLVRLAVEVLGGRIERVFVRDEARGGEVRSAEQAWAHLRAVAGGRAGRKSL